jgi:hypothetical protein
MEGQQMRNTTTGVTEIYRTALYALILIFIGGLAFAAGLSFSAKRADAAEKREPRVVYPKKTDLDFEGLAIEGEIRNPGEFYFQRKPEEKFDSLVKRRKNFHREMLRDAVLSK